MSPGVYRKSRPRPLLRNLGASERIEGFLVSAVLAILGIRLYLELANYPTIGGDGLHIAHMLWGGVFMLIALLLLLGFVGRKAQWAGAILGGVGFGTFIDELGKFVTHDNDYFYRPAIAVIYVVFVLTYLAVRRILGARQHTRDEYLVNAIQELEEIALHDLDAEERERAQGYLDRADPSNPLVPLLRELLRRPDLTTSAPRRNWRRRLHHAYERTVNRPWFARALITFFVLQALLKLSQGIAVLLFYGLGRTGVAGLRFVGGTLENLENLPVAGWGELSTSLLAALLTLVGVVRVVRSRLAGYYWFQRAILVSVLLTQVFMFYREQTSAVVGLLPNVAILAALGYMIAAERRLRRRDREPRDA